MSETFGLASLQVRPGHPDFLDLPWAEPLERWEGRCSRLVELERGISRHEVRFVQYDDSGAFGDPSPKAYALKQLPGHLGPREYASLRWLEDKRLPSVVPIGHARVITEEGEASILITRFLDMALPYRTLFQSPGFERYRARLFDSIAGLLVRLHLAGFFWGDFSLSNCLFLRDAGQLQAYLVDAETSEMHESLSDGQRGHDLMLLEDNVAGELADVAAVSELPPDFDIFETGPGIRRRYEQLWSEVSRVDVVTPSEGWRIQERIRSLNKLGFSVGEIELEATGDGSRLAMRPVVTDRDFFRHLVQNLTGLVTEERQAELMANEIQEMRATLGRAAGGKLTMQNAAYRWLNERYKPMVQRLDPLVKRRIGPPAELYCQLLEHKWFLSEKAKQDVGLEAALADYIKQFEGGGVAGPPSVV